MHKLHSEILEQIKSQSGKPTQHTFLDGYLGNPHPRYPISVPLLRKIAREWMRSHRDLSAKEFAAILTSLVQGESSTEKSMAGFLLDYSKPEQRQFDPKLFDKWLDHLVGWMEVDSLCTGDYSATAVVSDFQEWEPLLIKLSRSKNIQKRRASLVMLCKPVGAHDADELAQLALQNIDRLKSEKEILITKAISWLLRSMIPNFRKTVQQYVNDNAGTLPSIAVRETKAKLLTGRKSK